MTYANGRVLYDADSHILELPDFLERYADPASRDDLPEISFYADGGPKLERVFKQIIDNGRRHDDALRESARGLGDAILSGPRGYKSHGAFDNTDRSEVLDMLGFKRQLVFATFSAIGAFEVPEPGKAYAAARALNRGIGEFCADDERLLGVGAVPMYDRERALEELEFALAQNAAAIWVPTGHWAGLSPGHGDWDPFWARLTQSGVPFVLHVGGSARTIDKEWLNNGQPMPGGFEPGSGEHVIAREMTSLHHAAELFLTMCIFDGVFERHPTLQGACVELGAGWVPQFLDRLDWVVDIWGRSDASLRALSAKPSEIASAHLAFTPYVYEDVGKLIQQSNADLYLFSSDYPHAEGGKDPLRRFDASLANAQIGVEAQAKFFAENLQRVLP